ncbi:D-2-hydroxyacid dehydrogenase [soil metagenome]
MTRGNKTGRTVVAIGSPLEIEYVDQINAADHDGVHVLFRPDLLPPRQYVADHTGPAGWARSPQQQQEWEHLLVQADVLWDLPGNAHKPVLELCPKLKWVQTTSAGVGPAIKRAGLADTDVIVTTSSGIHAAPLAEFVFASLLFHTKRMVQLLEWQRERTWERYAAGELRGQTLVVVGPGRIGREVARIGKAFGMTVIAVGVADNAARHESLGVDEYVSRSGLDDALGRADCVVLCCPITPATEGMIGRGQIAAMKPGVALVNIARGAVVDEGAMIEALQDGHIGFAALDVFQVEPLPRQSPLWSMPNVLINPHSASTAFAENQRITDIFIRNLHRFLDGKYDEMVPLLDKKRGY